MPFAELDLIVFPVSGPTIAYFVFYDQRILISCVLLPENLYSYGRILLVVLQRQRERKSLAIVTDKFEAKFDFFDEVGKVFFLLFVFELHEAGAHVVIS